MASAAPEASVNIHLELLSLLCAPAAPAYGGGRFFRPPPPPWRTASWRRNKEEIQQLILVRREHRKKDAVCLAIFDKLGHELTDRKKRRESTARRREEALRMEITELVQFQAELVTSGTPMARGTVAEEEITIVKDALGVEEADRDRLDRIATLHPSEQRRARSIGLECVQYEREILNYRKVQAAEHRLLTPVVRNQNSGSEAAAWSSFGAVKAKLLSFIRFDFPTRSGDEGVLRPSLASFSLDRPVFLKPVLNGNAVRAMRWAGMCSDALLQKGGLYELVGSIRPARVKILGKRSRKMDGVSARIFSGVPASIHSFEHVERPWVHLSEFLTSSVLLHAGFNAEVKSVSSKTSNKLVAVHPNINPISATIKGA